MVDALQHASEGWFDYMQQSVLSESASNYTQIIGLNAEVMEILAKSEGALFESLSTARKDSRKESKSSGLKDKTEKIFAAAAIIPPAERMQRIVILWPEGWEKTEQTHGVLHLDKEVPLRPVMYEWKGIIRRQSHAARRRELLR